MPTKLNNDLLTTLLGFATEAALGYVGYKTGNPALYVAGWSAATGGYLTNKQ